MSVLTNQICRICGNDTNNKIYQVKEMMFGFRDTFSYFECMRCGCLQISEIPLNISRYYPPQYYSFSLPAYLSENSVKTLLEQLLNTMQNKFTLFNRGLIRKRLYSRFPDDSRGDSAVFLFREKQIIGIGFEVN